MPDRNLEFEFEKRDAQLDRIEEVRAAAVTVAKGIRDQLISRNGSVTSVEVIDAMRAGGWVTFLDRYDKRWLGAVFRAGQGLERTGWTPAGSHGRPVAIWKRCNEL